MVADLRIVVLFLLSLILVTSAAEPATRPALLPIVEVAMNDGTVVRGRLHESDGLGLVVQPTLPGQEKRTLRWRDVKRVNNGLTQQKAAEAWKTLHKENLCTDCKGDRVLLCPTCKGTAHDLSARANCPTCKGAGQSACAGPKCDKGQIPCTGPCLKAAGPWRVRDGQKMREFPMVGGGVFWVSDGHVGEVVEIKNGRATGSLLPCPVCQAKKTINCPVCNGTTLEVCKVCAKSNTAPCPDKCDLGIANCKTCTGTGIKPPETQPAPEVPAAATP